MVYGKGESQGGIHIWIMRSRKRGERGGEEGMVLDINGLIAYLSTDEVQEGKGTSGGE